jgi:hypothetical protein
LTCEALNAELYIATSEILPFQFSAELPPDVKLPIVNGLLPSCKIAVNVPVAIVIP